MLIAARTGETFTDRKGKQGRRLQVTIGPLSLPAIERGDGYVYLRPGIYKAEFGYWTSKSGKKARAIRILGVYDDRVYLHPANWPWQLEGCIAPGTSATKTGVANSRDAMDLIFEALGGFELKKRFEIEVRGSP